MSTRPKKLSVKSHHTNGSTLNSKSSNLQCIQIELSERTSAIFILMFTWQNWRQNTEKKCRVNFQNYQGSHTMLSHIQEFIPGTRYTCERVCRLLLPVAYQSNQNGSPKYIVSQKNCTPKAGRYKFIKISSPTMIFHTRHRHSVAVEYQLPGFHGNQAPWQLLCK